VTARRTFRCQPEAVNAARRFVRDVLSDQSLEIVEAAELMASELATNCVRHAHTDFELAIRSQGQIRIEVRDTGHGRPRLLSPTPQEPAGRGLRIVEAMSDAWGVIPAPNGKAVWCTLPQPGASSEAPSARGLERSSEEGRERRTDSAADDSRLTEQPRGRTPEHSRRSVVRGTRGRTTSTRREESLS
jgi:anti-sigma regulatory factor (Ser/Thr protein kinase)